MARRHPSGAPFPHVPDHRSPTSGPEPSGRRPNRTASHPPSFRSPVQYPRRPPVSRAQGLIIPLIHRPFRAHRSSLVPCATDQRSLRLTLPRTISRPPVATASVQVVRSALGLFGGRRPTVNMSVCRSKNSFGMWFLPGHRWSLGMVTLSSRYPSNELVLGLPAFVSSHPMGMGLLIISTDRLISGAQMHA